jgi:hypothetical protein
LTGPINQNGNFAPGEWVTVRTIPGEIVNDPQRSNQRNPVANPVGNSAAYSPASDWQSASSPPMNPNIAQHPNSPNGPNGHAADYGNVAPSYTHGTNSYSNGPQGQGGHQDRTVNNQSTANQDTQQNVAEQLFRFDLQPEDIAIQFPRVSTHLIESGLSGMRVPLVSGTNPSDLAGSLTYFFDAQNQLQRVAFQGTTGNPSGLIDLMQSQFGMKAEPTLGGGTFLARNRGNPQVIQSALRMRRAPVMREDQPLYKYFVNCEVNHPDRGQISPLFQSVLMNDARSKRWQPGGNNAARAVAAPNNQAPTSRPANPLERPPDPRTRPPEFVPRATTSPMPARASPG